MKPTLLVSLLALTVVPTTASAAANASSSAPSATAPTPDLMSRIQHAQNSLRSHGSNAEVLFEYDELISALKKTPSGVSKHTLAQVWYQRCLIEIGLNKAGPAIADLVEALEIDPSFSPASKKLLEMWLDRGQFAEIRAKYPSEQYPDAYARMEAWENAYTQVLAVAEAPKDTDAINHALELVQNTLLAITPSNVLVYDLRLKLSKQRATLSAGSSEDDLYGDILRDYAHMLRLSPQRSLEQYSAYSQYLLFSRGSFDDAWSAVKGCLRIDNDEKSCGSLSKMYNRMQQVLKPLEEYFILNEFLYPASSSVSDLPEEKLHAFNVDFKSLYDVLTGPVSLSKRDMKNLPSGIDSVYEFIIYRAKQFALAEFGHEHLGMSFPLVDVLNKLVCEASVRAKGNKKKYCALVEDSAQPFLPKHLAHIDSLLKKKDYHAAHEILAQYNQNIQKTSLFQKRWKPVQEFELRRQQRQQQQQQQQQQEEFYRHQQHQHQQQQQQQQQNKFDRSKDYYKLLDVSKDADEKTLKKAYRTQTLKYHPDKYKGKDLTEKEIESKMQDINEAYEVLSDPEARAEYDRPEGHGHHGHGGGGGHYQQNHGSQNVHFNFDPSQFMGQFGGGGGGFNFHF
ncbi:hypothetical protein JCM33374_g4077 [Metschnikowia sp. JCM 33374]|nr:hypothetical protein JCM33374_g4077 [Metschnikowia sp. JCM 33374]